MLALPMLTSRQWSRISWCLAVYDAVWVRDCIALYTSTLPMHMHRGVCILFLRRLCVGLSRLATNDAEGWEYLRVASVYRKAGEL